MMKTFFKISKKDKHVHLISFMFILILASGMIGCGRFNSGKTSIDGLSVNYSEDPIGIEKENILFSWKMKSGEIGQNQTAYQISVTEENGNEIWNSGLVKSELSVAIPYSGPVPAIETRYNWTVKVTCADGGVVTSKPAFFETGTDFKDAEWIYYKPQTDNFFNSSMKVSMTTTILKDGFTLYFGIKNETNRLAWSFSNNLLVATKVSVSGSVPLDTIDLKGIIGPNRAFNLEVNLSDGVITTMINGKQVSEIEHSFKIERPYVGVSVSAASVDRRTQVVTRPAQSAKFSNIVLTVDDVSENIGEPNFTLTPVTPAPAAAQQGMPGNTGGSQGASFMQTVYNGKPVEYLAESTAMPLFRTEKALKGEVKSARLYITSLGIYRAYINGQEVMLTKTDGTKLDDAFSPGWTNYNDYIYYRTYDVTDLLDAQNVVLGAEVGTGWYAGYIGRQYYASIGEKDINELSLLARLVVNYTDGTQEVIGSKADEWVASENGPVLSNDFFYGEVYDARLEDQVKNWNNVGFDASTWNKVSKINYSPKLVGGNDNTAYMLEEDRIYPKVSQATYIYDPENIKTTEELKFGEIVPTIADPTRTISLEKGKRLIIDLGQNIAGITNISFSGIEGTKVQLRGAEMLNDGKENPLQRNGGSCGPKGTLYWYGLTRGRATDEYWYTDIYYMNNKGIQEYQPGFTFHGYRYLEIWADNDIEIQKVYAQPITSAVTQTGFIETNNKNVNQLFSNTLWSQMGNFLTIPTDCPNRSERLGWSGDVTVFTETALFNFDAVSFLSNYMDISGDYAKNNGGYFGTTMPGASRGQGSSNAGWTDVAIILTWSMYQQTGDIGILEKYYGMLSEYMSLVMANGLTPGYGDWVAFQSTSNVFMAAMYQAYDAELMTKIATALGKTEDADKYMAENNRLVEAMRTKYVDDKGNVLSVSADPARGGGFMQGDNTSTDNSQTGILWSLKMGLDKSSGETDVFIKNLLTNIDNTGRQNRPNSAEKTLSTGFLGVNVLLPQLTENGLKKNAYDLLLQDEMPSWLYEVKNGATTTWERWNAYTSENSFGDYGMNSFNHYAYGAVGEWMFEYMAGIQKDELKPGFKNIILQPTFDNGTKYNDQDRINSVKGRYDSYYGTIESNWTAEEGELKTYETVIPANTTATLYLPLESTLTEGSDLSLIGIPGVVYIGMTKYNGENVAEFKLASGGYHFEIRNDKLVARLLKGYSALK